MKVREERTTLTIKVPNSQIEKIFQDDKDIKKIYLEGRGKANHYYYSVIRALQQEFNEDETIVRFLESGTMVENHEIMIKARLLEMAVAKVLSGEKSNIKPALIDEVDEGGIPRAITYLEDVLRETLRDFCHKMDEDPIFRAGLQFID